MFHKDIEVKAVWFHKAVMVPGVIGSEVSLADEKYPGIRMYATGEIFHIDYKGVSAFCHLSNISFAVCKEYQHGAKVVPLKK
jgi:hypothetical protein